MTSLRLRAATALLLASFAAACGSDEGGSSASFSDSVTTAEATEFANGAAETASYLADNLNFGTPEIAVTAQALYTRLMNKPEVAAFRARMPGKVAVGANAPNWQVAMRPAGIQLADGCSYSGHGFYEFPMGNPVDLNENGVPDDAALDVVCIYTEEGGADTVWTIREEQHVKVKEIDGSLYGMNVSFQILQRVTNNKGLLEEIQVDQAAKIDLRSGSASTDQSMKFTGKFDEGDHEGAESGEGAFGEEWGADFDADGTIVEGDPLPDGLLILRGRSFYYEEPDGRNLSFSITTPTALAYDAGCAAIDDDPPFTAGVLLGRLNGSSAQASFEVTFTGCGSYTVAVDNANDPAVVAAQ
jgi:hypothetical protein